MQFLPPLLLRVFGILTNANSSNLQPFDVGGVEVVKNEFPWMVHLNNGNNVFCGGTLIKLDLVLTAAHCLEKLKASDVTVTAGDHDLNKIEGTEQTVTALYFKIHESYHTDYIGRLKNDLAIITLDKGFRRTNSVRPINLLAANTTKHRRGIVLGWRNFRNDKSSSNVLMKVEVPIITNNVDCTYLLTDPSAQFCDGQIGKDICQGAYSGGPFISSDRPDQIYGIVSYGNGCGKKGWPGIYQRVGPYDAWIKENDSSTLLAHHLGLLVAVVLIILVSHQ